MVFVRVVFAFKIKVAIILKIFKIKLSVNEAKLVCELGNVLLFNRL